MKINVKKTEYMEVECIEPNSQLINKMYKQYFINDIVNSRSRMQIDKETGYLVEYYSTSANGKLTWQKVVEIKDEDMIKLHQSLVDAYFLIKKLEKNGNK